MHVSHPHYHTVVDVPLCLFRSLSLTLTLTSRSIALVGSFWQPLCLRAYKSRRIDTDSTNTAIPNTRTQFHTFTRQTPVASHPHLISFSPHTHTNVSLLTNSIKNTMTTHRIDRIILIEQELYDNQTFISTLKEVMITLLQPQYIHHNSTFVFQQNFTVPIELQLKLESSDANAQNVIYISSRFEGTLFEQLSANKKPIISDIIVYQCIANRNVIIA